MAADGAFLVRSDPNIHTAIGEELWNFENTRAFTDLKTG